MRRAHAPATPWGARLPPRTWVRQWVDACHRADVDALMACSTDDALNHQVADAPVHGHHAMRPMFEAGFASAMMVCLVEHIVEEGEWAILEWREPVRLRGGGVFHVVRGQIMLQRGYWDKRTFLRLEGLPVPREP
jgi:limonene-1,2-epoxide hydrolase